jgi:membrane protease YdiL (CAAX protease family)
MLVLLGLIPLACVWLLRRHGWLGIAGFNPVSRWREPWLIWAPALLVLLNLVNALAPGVSFHFDGSAILSAAVQAISVPLIEESLFRGLILAILLYRFGPTRAGVMRAVWLQALLFGLWHLPPNPDIAWQVNVANVIYTVFIGVGFAATMLRTRSTWLVMVVHMLVVFSNAGLSALITGRAGRLAEMAPTQDAWLSAAIPVIVTIPLAVYGMWLLRDVSRLELRPASE